MTHSERNDAERQRLQGEDAGAWRRWGPYLSERAWGTVREDYSADGDAWSFFPHDHARSRAYRWNEDGLAGLSDDRQRLCFALALWNGADPILKERAFGLTGPEGNHGEDVKEYWWFVDSTPTHSWMRWRYVYPQRAFPYDGPRRGERPPRPPRPRVRAARHRRLRRGPLLRRRRRLRQGGCRRHLHPHHRHEPRPRRSDAAPAADPLVPRHLELAARGGRTRDHRVAGRRARGAGTTTSGPWRSRATAIPTPLFCDNATNTQRLWGQPGPAYPKDGINDHVVDGAADGEPGADRDEGRAAPCARGAGRRQQGDPAAAVAPPRRPTSRPTGTRVLAARAAEADDFYAALSAGATADEAPRHPLRDGRDAVEQAVLRLRRAHLARRRSRRVRPRRRSGCRAATTAGRTSTPRPSSRCPTRGSTRGSRPGTSPSTASPSRTSIRRSRSSSSRWCSAPAGCIRPARCPAYEWDFGAVNPPVHAWAALHVFRRDGGTDLGWLRQVFERLHRQLTWWVAKNDPEGNGTFTGGFLGMDNIGPFDRGAIAARRRTRSSRPTRPAGWRCSALSMLEIAVVLRRRTRRWRTWR